jgi:hypothetical protein
MAYRNTITSNSDPIINMVRTANIVLAKRGAEEIRRTLNDHAFPQIRLRILSASSSYVNGEGSGSNQGRSLWFDDLTDLSDPLVQATVDGQIDSFIQGNPLIQDAVYSIAARIAAHHLTLSNVGQVTQQTNVAQDLRKEALSDLEKLIRTPFFDGAVASVKETQLAARKMPRIFIANDINDDDSTYNTTDNTGEVYPGATVPGLAQLYIGYKTTDVVSYEFPAGTTAPQILAGLTQAWRLAQEGKSLIGDPVINVVLAPDEGRPVTGIRKVLYKTYPGAVPVTTRTPSVSTNMGFVQVAPYLYDKAIDFLNVQLSLRHETVSGSGIYDLPGVPGILYGTEPLYSALTQEGPHAVLIDLETGEKLDTTSTTKEDKTISDTFYFGIAAPPDPASATAQIAGTVVAGDQFDVTVGTTTYSVTAGAGDTPTTIVAALAAAIQSAGAFSGGWVTTDPTILSVTSLSLSAADNNVPFLVAVTNAIGSTATFTSGFTILDGGRGPNTLPTGGTIRFRFQEMVDTANPVPTSVNRTRSITVNRGDYVLDVVRKMADDIAEFSKTSRCLGAVRAPTYFKLMGSAFHAPGLTIVPYTRDLAHYQVVFDILEVPDGLLFAPLPYELIPNPGAQYYFDDLPKSLVVTAKTLTGSGTAASSKVPAISETDQGEVKLSQPKVSPWLAKISREIRNHGGWS